MLRELELKEQNINTLLQEDDQNEQKIKSEEEKTQETENEGSPLVVTLGKPLVDNHILSLIIAILIGVALCMVEKSIR